MKELRRNWMFLLMVGCGSAQVVPDKSNKPNRSGTEAKSSASDNLNKDQEEESSTTTGSADGVGDEAVSESPVFQDVNQEPESQDSVTQDSVTQEPVIQNPNNEEQVVAQFNLSNVKWLGTNIANWEVRANLPSIEFRNGQICLGYDKANDWQVRTTNGGVDVVANPWVFIEKDGVWYGATWEWMRPGQHCKAMTSVAGDHIKKYNDFSADWKPQSGQKLGFMVSTLIRFTDEKNDNGQSSRTDVVFTTWP